MTYYKALSAELLAAIEWNYGDPSIDRMALTTRARAALAEPEPPVDGEVAELVAELRHFVSEYQQMRGLDPEKIYSIQQGHPEKEAHLRSSQLTRAADLLERLAELEPPAITPIPMSDRLPGEEDCDTKGRCWFWKKSDERWELLHGTNAQSSWTWIWLPFHALPLPAGDDA